MTVRAATSNVSPDSTSSTRTPVTSRAARRKRGRPGRGHHRRTEAGRGTGQRASPAGRRRPGRRSNWMAPPTVSARSDGKMRRAAARAQVPVQRHAATPAERGRRTRRRRRPRRRSSRAAGRPCQRFAGQRQQERHRPDQMGREPGGEQSPLLQRLVDQARGRAAPGSAGRRGRACSTARTCRTARSRASTRATERPREAASTAAPAPVTPPPTMSTSNRSRRSRPGRPARRSGRGARPRSGRRTGHARGPRYKQPARPAVTCA